MGITKATISNMDDGGTPLQCLFNPTEYSISKANSWQPKPSVGKDVPEIEFTGGAASTLTLQLFFDVYEQADGDVRRHTDALMALALVDPTKKNRITARGRPPIVLFQWGANWSFKAVISNLNLRFTLFNEHGIPVRATADVTFTQVENEGVFGFTNPTSFSEPGHRRLQVQPHDTLASIAFREYGDSGYWRRIADANALDDPMNLKPGLILAIPPL